VLAGNRLVEPAQIDRRLGEGVAQRRPRPRLGRIDLADGGDLLAGLVEHARAELEALGRQHEAVDGGEALAVLARLHGEAQGVRPGLELQRIGAHPGEVVAVGAVVRDVGAVMDAARVRQVPLVVLVGFFPSRFRQFLGGSAIQRPSVPGCLQIQADPQLITAIGRHPEGADDVAAGHALLVKGVPPVLPGQRGGAIHRIVPVVGLLQLVAGGLGLDPDIAGIGGVEGAAGREESGGKAEGGHDTSTDIRLRCDCQGI